MRRRKWFSIVAVLALVGVGAGCGSDDDGGGASTATTPTSIGEGEGALSIVAWAGYIERGDSDKNYDWVTPFEKDTGCKVSVKTAGTSDEMVSLMTGSKTYDLVTASGDASLRLVAGNRVQPVDLSKIPSYAKVTRNGPCSSFIWMMRPTCGSSSTTRTWARSVVTGAVTPGRRCWRGGAVGRTAARRGARLDER